MKVYLIEPNSAKCRYGDFVLTLKLNSRIVLSELPLNCYGVLVHSLVGDIESNALLEVIRLSVNVSILSENALLLA